MQSAGIVAALDEAPPANVQAAVGGGHAFIEMLTSPLGSLIVSLIVLGALKLKLLPRLHKAWFQMMSVLLRESPMNRRPYRQSLLSAAQNPLIVLFWIRVLCHTSVLVSDKVLSKPAFQTVANYSGAILNLSFKICIGSILFMVVDQMIRRSSRGIAKKSDILGAETSRQESQVLAVGQTARVLVVVCTFLACLPVFKVNLGTVLSFCGMGGLAISLLSKGVFVNLIGSLTLYLTQPFTIGDWIQSGDGEVDGWVEFMGPYHTVLMKWDRKPMYIPNSRLVQVPIINASRMTNRRIQLDIPVRLNDMDKIDVVLGEIRDFIGNHKDLDDDQHRIVRLKEINHYCALIWVSCYTKGINLKDLTGTKQDILLGIKDIMFKSSINFATILERHPLNVDSTGRALPLSEQSVLMGASAALATQEQPPLEVEQRQIISEEIENLKDGAQKLWVRERDLTNSLEEVKDDEQKVAQEEQEMLEMEESIKQQEMELDNEVEFLAGKEEALQAEEEGIDLQLEEMQREEEKLDKVMASVRSPLEVPDKGALKKAPKDEQVSQKNSAKEQEKLEEKKQLDEAKKKLEQEQKMLEDKKAEMQQLEGSDEDADEPDGGVEEEEDQLDDAARYKQIAESLGGE